MLAASFRCCSYIFPTEKLSCKTASSNPRTPTVLVACGSFNPPTFMHVRMCELASQELAARGFDVWGCYLSPVADNYKKPGKPLEGLDLHALRTIALPRCHAPIQCGCMSSIRCFAHSPGCFVKCWQRPVPSVRLLQRRDRHLDSQCRCGQPLHHTRLLNLTFLCTELFKGFAVPICGGLLAMHAINVRCGYQKDASSRVLQRSLMACLMAGLPVALATSCSISNLKSGI